MTEIFSDIVSIAISLAALALSASSFYLSRASVVKEFFSQGDSAEMKKYRKVVYDIYNNESDEKIIFDKLVEHGTEVSHVISFFDCWALMVRKHYLPSWTFQASSKFVAVGIYDKVKPYIMYRRISQDEYASHFEWLIAKIR